MSDGESTDKMRLDRIESKIDKMTEAVIALARAEEKIANLDKSTQILLKRMVEQDERLWVVETAQRENTATIKTIRSLVWTTLSALITAAAGAIMWLIKGE
tara:strand:+ start:2889 stop:3191 length:303 start_codon:yes stop_codon:yes gene_type:complete